MTTNNIPNVAHPAHPQIAQPDGVHTAAIELDLAQKTQCLAYRNSGNAHSWAWPDPATAPYATLTALATWTAFDMGSAVTSTMLLPWLQQKQYPYVNAMAVIFAEQTYKYRVRMVADDFGLAESMSAVNGIATHDTTPMEWHPAAAKWQQIGKILYGSVVNCHLNLTDAQMPASRAYSIYFQAYLTDPSLVYSVSAQQKLRMASLTIWDSFDRDSL